jgi:hypothetical protein
VHHADEDAHPGWDREPAVCRVNDAAGASDTSEGCGVTCPYRTVVSAIGAGLDAVGARLAVRCPGTSLEGQHLGRWKRRG